MTSGLIDTTEMYLRTVFELEEEGVVPLRARLVERLHHSGPTVSETCARLEREGLLHIRPDRSLELTPEGHRIAVSVMRKHRLAELLLVDVIGMPYESVHAEACRWEHVISDEVEARLTTLLGDPATCPHGNPLPSRAGETLPRDEALVTLAEAAAPRSAVARAVDAEGRRVVVRRIGESVQGDADAMLLLDRAGVRPGASVRVRPAAGRAGQPGAAGSGHGAVRVEPLSCADGSSPAGTVDVPDAVADHVLVASA